MTVTNKQWNELFASDKHGLLDGPVLDKPILYKKGRSIICYIKYSERSNKFLVCTGKPSDGSCISWTYDNFDDAKYTAEEYLRNYTDGVTS